MIRRTALALLLGFPAAWAADEALPKAETIMDRYVEVTGGKAAYEKRKTETATGTLLFAAQGLKGKVLRYSAEPNQSYMAMELDGIGKIEQGTSGDIAWDKNPMLGPRVKSGDEKAQTLRESRFNDALHWRDLYPKAETIGVDTVDGDECYKVQLTPKEGKPETRFFSKKSGLLVKALVTAVTQMGEMNGEALFSDYKEFGGVKIATKTMQRVAGQEIVITLDTVKINDSLPANTFEPPADIKALLNKPAEKK